MTMGKRIESARESLGYKQHDLAEKMGISQQAIEKIENGKTKMPRDIDKMAKILKVSVEWLITGESMPINPLQNEKESKENKSVIELMNFLTESQKQSAIDFIKRLKEQNDQVFNELSDKMTTQRRIENLYSNNKGNGNHAHV
jgi:transcriptional regulator with XRE-family HTH domain